MRALIDKLHLREKEIITLFLGTNAIVGAVLFVIFILPRSEPNNQLILGLSVSRVLVAIIFLGLLLLNISALLILILEFGVWQKELKNKVAELFSNHKTPVMVALYAVLILTGTFLLLSIPPIIRPLSFLEPFSARLSSFIGWIFFTSLLFILMLRIIPAETSYDTQLMTRLDEILTLVGLFLIVFFLYVQFTASIGWVNKTKYSFWDLLSDAFLQGRLYLTNPPYIHDLTMYKGHWYVPMPPLPAILMLPLAYFIGGQNISTSYLSIVFSALNGVLVFLILQQLHERKWIQISRSALFLLVTIFLFGTPHLWLGISGRGWYFSQILTVFFLALAIYAALCSWSAWLIGVFIGAAMLARPNGLMTSPFVFAISMQILKEHQGNINLKHVLLWGLKTVTPIAIAIIGLLTYNYLRFENFMDFGYTTVNAGPDIVQNVKTWGLFSPHFIPINLRVMFFQLPFMPLTAPWPILPSATGMSVFLTTPPLIYLFQRYPKQWWVFGAWATVLFNIIFLSFYSNTGAHQFGYRYILDFLVPLITLLALQLKGKIPWHFIMMVLLSIIINLYGANWFMNG